MSTDTLIEALLEEAEAIVWAEWVRLQREYGLAGTDSVMPVTRRRPPKAYVRTAVTDGHGARRAWPGGQWPARRGPGRQVWPTQRAPPS